MDVYVPFALLLATMAGLSTGIGSALAWFMCRPRCRHLEVILGFSAGVMIYISFSELLTAAVERVGFITANIGFFIGMIVMAILDIAIPHEYKEERVRGSLPSSGGQDTAVYKDGAEGGRTGILFGPARGKERGKSFLMRAGVLTALGIAVHNLPEGLAVFASAAGGDIKLGLVVAIAVAIHNVPEGISVSAPILEATGSRRRAFVYSLSAGLAEPVGALMGYAILFPFVTPALLSALLAFAAGIMVYISLDELLPAAHQYGEAHMVIIGIGAGMAVMVLSLGLVGR